MYFDRRLGLATGVAAAGSGLGQLVFSPIFHHAEQELGLQGTLYLLAGLLMGFVFNMVRWGHI